MKTLLRIIKYIAITILLVLALMFLSILIQTKKNSDKIPSIFGYKPFIVLSGSMESELYKGDLAIVKVVDKKSLKKGDVIAFRDDKDYVVTHRIVDVTIKNGKEEFITKGDNNNKNDTGTVKNSRIEGKYVFKISKLGSVLLQLKKPFILCILLIVIIGTGIIWILFGNKKLSIEERRELEKYRRDSKK